MYKRFISQRTCRIFLRQNNTIDNQVLVRIYNSMLQGYPMDTDQQRRRLASTDINMVKADVVPFIRHPKELDIWSNDYFLQLANMIRLE